MKNLYVLLVFLASSICIAKEDDSSISRTQDFYNYLLKSGFDKRIGVDVVQQKNWLASNLVPLVVRAECDAARAFEESSQEYSYVDLELVLDRWDYPSSCSAIDLQKTPSGIKVRVNCIWAEGTNYQGTKIELFTYLVKEQDIWKISNIVHGVQNDSEFTGGKPTTTDFIARLKAAAKQSTKPELCEKNT